MKGVVTNRQRKDVYSISEEPINMYRLNNVNNLDLELKTFTDDKGVEHRYLISKDAAEKGSCTFFCGGSDLNMGKANYIDFIKNQKDKGFGLIVPIYPGFHEGHGSKKQKNATEENINASVAAIYEHVKQEEGIDPKKINMVGYSLGGPIAAKLVAENKELNNLTMVSPPSSVEQASIDELNPKSNKLKAWVLDKVKGLLGEKYDTVGYLGDISSQTDRNVKTTVIMDTEEEFATKKGKDGKTHFERIEEAVKNVEGSKCSKGNYVQDVSSGKTPHDLMIALPEVASTVCNVRSGLNEVVKPEEKVVENERAKEPRQWRQSVSVTPAAEQSQQRL